LTLLLPLLLPPGSSRANGSDRPAVAYTFLGGVEKPGSPADGPGEEKRLAAGKRPVPADSLGRGSIGIGGMVDRDELEVVGVGRP
jgi:hypothetical protein